MNDHTLEISGASIVLIGSFNPAIFQPQWFAKNGLITQGQADKAEIQVIHSQLCQFETENFVFQITADRFISTSKPNTIAGPLVDLVLGTFYILEHTPVQAMGLNRIMHFRMRSEDAWHRIGDSLAPKDPWTAILGGRPGMRSLDILTQLEVPNGSSVTVRVQPSLSVLPGVYFQINNHFASSERDGLKALMDTLRNRWDDLFAKGDEIADYILNWAAAQR